MGSRFVIFFISLIGFSSLGCADKSDLIVPDISITTIYVSNRGSDSWQGTADHPFSTIGKAQEMAYTTGAKDIIISEGEFSSNLHIIGGINLSGGFDSSTWERIPNTYSRINSRFNQNLGQDIQVPTEISGLEFIPGSNLAPMTLFGCGPDLHFVDCRFIAHSTNNGLDGYSGSNARDLDPDSYDHPGGPGHCTESIDAPGGRLEYSLSGSGGYGGLPNSPGQDGINAFSQHSDFPESGLGGAGGLPGQPGQNGSAGADSPDGENGELVTTRAQFQGTLLTLPEPERAERGIHGHWGGGGGGGGGSLTGTGNGGGIGGPGGNPGDPGRGGSNAYPSIAVISSNSRAHFSNCFFKTGTAGNGGNGGIGGQGNLGLPGSLGGTECTPDVGAGGQGGSGGKGGDAGAGSGGHGGDNFGLWVLGNFLPSMDTGCVFELGTAGLGGVGGMHGNGESNAPSGWDGRRANTFIESESQ